MLRFTARSKEENAVESDSAVGVERAFLTIPRSEVFTERLCAPFLICWRSALIADLMIGIGVYCNRWRNPAQEGKGFA